MLNSRYGGQKMGAFSSVEHSTDNKAADNGQTLSNYIKLIDAVSFYQLPDPTESIILYYNLAYISLY